MMGNPATAIMTITAGAISIKPSRRSARAPSDRRLRCFRSVTSGSPVVTTSVLAVIGSLPFYAFRSHRLAGAPGPSWHSRDHQLRLKRLIDLCGHRLLGARRVDARGRGHLVRDDDGDALVRRSLRPNAGVLQGGQDVGVERVVGE